MRYVEISGPAGLLEGLIKRKTEQSPGLSLCSAIRFPPRRTMHTKPVPRGKGAGPDRCSRAAIQFPWRRAKCRDFLDGPASGRTFGAALAFMMARYPDVKRVWCGGMSFGSWVALTVGAEDPHVTSAHRHRLPRHQVRYSRRVVAAGKPTFPGHGERDELVPLQEIRTFYALLPDPKELVVIDGADHLFEARFPKSRRDRRSASGFQ